jgi:hypothetical protein
VECYKVRWRNRSGTLVNQNYGVRIDGRKSRQTEVRNRKMPFSDIRYSATLGWDKGRLVLQYHVMKPRSRGKENVRPLYTLQNSFLYHRLVAPESWSKLRGENKCPQNRTPGHPANYGEQSKKSAWWMECEWQLIMTKWNTQRGQWSVLKTVSDVSVIIICSG